MSREIAMEDAPEILLGRAGRRAVIVRQVEVGDAEVERAPQHGPAILEGVHAAEIVPKTERNGREQQSAAAAPPVLHVVVTRVSGRIGHEIPLVRI
jgi:hypothetical protein